MTLLGQSRSRRLMLAVTVSGICAATLAAPSRADDDAAAPQSLLPTEVAAVPGLGESAPAIVADAIETATTALDEASQAADAGDPEEEAGSDGIPTDAGTVPSPVDTDEDDNADSDENAPSQAPSEVDTTPGDGDTAFDSTETAPPTVDPTSATEATAPLTSSTPKALPPAALNVNVSVRVDSGGDNGAVTQLNAAAAAPARMLSEQSPTPTAAPTTPGATAAAPTPTAAAQSSPAPTSNWYWEWDCLSAPSISAIPPSQSNAVSGPSSWTWIWNCGGNSEQYRTETPNQYQQINANVSIRFSSPGDDGPVSQTNVTAGFGLVIPPISLPSVQLPWLPGAPIPGLPTVTLPSISMPSPLARVVLPGISLGVALTAPNEIVLPPTVSFGDGASEVAIGNSALPVGAALDVAPTPAGPNASLVAVPEVHGVGLAPHPTGFLHRATVAGRSADAPRVAGRLTAAAWAETPLVAAANARGGHRPDPAPAAKPAPSWKPSTDADGSRAPATAPTGASASAAGAGGSAGGGLPIFLALPFLVAVLDLARRVALERVTWPSGHRARMPDTPG